ncbi:class I SAM-dependent methyltransferase [Frankia sp. CcI49]|uniref:class I SAM-dependent methyltransferase n=1 Tax=Frankia sp. CcI49 TaxID=1745382 RepID=UPI001F5207AA|nr:class I SAM-dependent methyltransferase [Frankia sp. CcI49]
MDELTMDGLTVDGIAMETISMGGFTIDEITVERILPPGAQGRGTTPERDDDPVRIPVRSPSVSPARGGWLAAHPPAGGLELGGFTFADLEPAGLGRLGLDLRRLELLAGFDAAEEWLSSRGLAGVEVSRFEPDDPAVNLITDLTGRRTAAAGTRLGADARADTVTVTATSNGLDRGSDLSTGTDAGTGAGTGTDAGQRGSASSPGPGSVPAPRPSTMVFERAAHDYDADVHGIPFFRPLGRTLVSAAGVRPGEDVVDLACGRGAVLIPAAEATGPTGSVRAFDLAPTMVALTAADVTARSLPWATVAVADATNPPVEPASADVLLCGMGLFLLPDPAGALARWRGLLRPGGRLAVSVFGAPDPLWSRPDYPLRLATGLGAADRRPGQAILAEGALARALTAAGFELTRDDLVATDLVFRDVEHWWHWAWGTAVRSMLEKVDNADLPAMIDDLTRWHAPSVDAGGLHWRPTIRIVTATVGAPRG